MDHLKTWEGAEMTHLGEHATEAIRVGILVMKASVTLLANVKVSNETNAPGRGA